MTKVSSSIRTPLNSKPIALEINTDRIEVKSFPGVRDSVAFDVNSVRIEVNTIDIDRGIGPIDRTRNGFGRTPAPFERVRGSVDVDRAMIPLMKVLSPRAKPAQNLDIGSSDVITKRFCRVTAAGGDVRSRDSSTSRHGRGDHGPGSTIRTSSGRMIAFPQIRTFRRYRCGAECSGSLSCSSSRR